MKLSTGVWVCAWALLPHSHASESSSFAYGSHSDASTSTSSGQRAQLTSSTTTPAGNSKHSGPIRVTKWTAPNNVPWAAFESYHTVPGSGQPWPAIHDDYLNVDFPANLTDPVYVKQIVPNVVNFPNQWPNPEQKNPTTVFYQSIDAAAKVINGSEGTVGNCSRCIEVITAGQDVARLAPSNFSDALISLCKTLKFKSDLDCERAYAKDKPEPAIWAQILQSADVRGDDGQFICSNMFGASFCDKPKARSVDINFGSDKPADAKAPPPSGKRIKVLHLSDIHLDPRYTNGAEALNCPSSGCCRTDPDNHTVITNPAPMNGHPNCDTPLMLLVSALSSVEPLNFVKGLKIGQHPIAFTIFTGDVMPRENPSYRNDHYLAYIQTAVYKLLKWYLPNSPVYPVLGALDAFNEEPSVTHPLVGSMRTSQSNNYNNMLTIVDTNKWLSKEESAAIAIHHMGYTAKHPRYPKLRIIALNTNFWSLQNYYNYVNTTAPRDSIILSDLIGWLLQAEKAQERVWIVGHIPPFASQSLPSHSEAFYQVLERFTPHVIAGVFFGHLHTDSVGIFYKDGGKDVSKEDNVVMTAWLAPSLSPKNGNPAYKVYEVDTGDFRIYESLTYFTNASDLAPSSLASKATGDTSAAPYANTTSPTSSGSNSNEDRGLLWQLGCDVRSTYGKAINWPADAPINAAFWHRVSNKMLQVNSSDGDSLLSKYRSYKSLSGNGPCNAACANATVCRMRAAKESLWERCGNDEVSKNAIAYAPPHLATYLDSTSNSTGSSKNGSAMPIKRNAGTDIEIEIYLDGTSDENGIQQGPQPVLQKRRVNTWWSNAAAKVGGVVATGAKGSSQAPSRPPQGTQTHATHTITVSGTTTKTKNVQSTRNSATAIKRGPGHMPWPFPHHDLDGNDDPLNIPIEKRMADADDMPPPLPESLDHARVEARSADPEPIPSAEPEPEPEPEAAPEPEPKKSSSWDLLPPATTQQQGPTGGGADILFSGVGEYVSTGYQYLDFLTSERAVKTSYSILRIASTITKARRDHAPDPFGAWETGKPGVEADSGSDDGPDVWYAPGPEGSHQPVAGSFGMPADPPDTATTAPPNEATTANVGEDWIEDVSDFENFSIYRPSYPMDTTGLPEKTVAPESDLEDDNLDLPSSLTGFDYGNTHAAKRTAFPDPLPEPVNKLQSIWSSLFNAGDDATSSSNDEPPAVKRTAVPEPLPDAIDRLKSLWASRAAKTATLNKPAHTDAPAVKRTAMPGQVSSTLSLIDSHVSLLSDLKVAEKRESWKSAHPSSKTKTSSSSSSSPKPANKGGASTSCSDGYCAVFYSTTSSTTAMATTTTMAPMANGVF